MENMVITLLIPFLVSLAFYLLIGPVVVLLCLLNEFVRLLVSFHLKIKYDGNIQLVPEGADALWALKRQERTRIAVVAIKLNKPISPTQITECLKNTVLQVQDGNGNQIYGKLQNILVSRFGYACWKRDEKFDLKNHVRSLSPKKLFTKKEIQHELRNLLKDMSEERAQWEMITVPRFLEDDNEPESSLVIFRFLHAYMDGFSLLMMVKNHMSSGFEYFLHPQKFQLPFWKKLLFYTNAWIFGPYTFLHISLNKFKCFWPKLPSKGLSKTSYTWTKSMDLEVIRKLRKSFNSATIPTILENAFISAAREVLPASRIPDQFSIGELAALLPYPDDSPQNRFAIFSYNINSLQSDFERIEAAREVSWKAITSPWIPLSYFMFKLCGRMPLLMHHVVLGGGSNSMMLSNMPLSKTRFKFLETAKVLEVLGFPPQPNDTGITLVSAAYQESLKISASAESTWLEEDELEEIVGRIPGILEEWAQTLENNNMT